MSPLFFYAVMLPPVSDLKKLQFQIYVSQHSVGSNECPPQTPLYDIAVMIRVVSGGEGGLCCRGTQSFLDSYTSDCCCFFQSFYDVMRKR